MTRRGYGAVVIVQESLH